MFLNHKISLIQVLRLKNVSLMDWKLECCKQLKILVRETSLKISSKPSSEHCTSVWAWMSALFCPGLKDLPSPDIFTVTHSCVGTALTALAQFRGRSCAWCYRISGHIFFFLNTSATTSGRIVLESCLSFCMHPGRGLGCCFHSQGEKPHILDPLKAFQHRWWAGGSLRTEKSSFKKKRFL